MEWMSKAGEEWVKKNQGARAGMELEREERIVWREMVLKALRDRRAVDMKDVIRGEHVSFRVVVTQRAHLSTPGPRRSP